MRVSEPLAREVRVQFVYWSETLRFVPGGLQRRPDGAVAIIFSADTDRPSPLKVRSISRIGGPCRAFSPSIRQVVRSGSSTETRATLPCGFIGFAASEATR